MPSDILKDVLVSPPTRFCGFFEAFHFTELAKLSQYIFYIKFYEELLRGSFKRYMQGEYASSAKIHYNIQLRIFRTMELRGLTLTVPIIRSPLMRLDDVFICSSDNELCVNYLRTILSNSLINLFQNFFDLRIHSTTSRTAPSPPFFLVM